MAFWLTTWFGVSDILKYLHREIDDYTIIGGDRSTRRELGKVVRFMLKEGYIPQGPPVKDHSGYWHQAMIKYKD